MSNPERSFVRKQGQTCWFPLRASVRLVPAGDGLGQGDQAWEGTITIPTYGWAEDVNPKFWALEDQIKLSTTVKGAIVYPYSDAGPPVPRRRRTARTRPCSWRTST